MFPPVVRGIILNQDWEILMTRHRWGDGTWVFPGGHVEAQESLQDALVRELEEEFALPISFLPFEEEYLLIHKGKPLDMLPIPLASYQLSYTNKEWKDKSRTEYIFLAMAEGNVGKTQAEEIAEYRWIDPELLAEGKEKTYDFYIQILERLLYEEQEGEEE